MGGSAGLGMAIARHGAAGASAAAGGLPLLFVADEGVHQQAKEQDQTGDDEDGGEMDRHGNLLSGGKFGFIATR